MSNRSNLGPIPLSCLVSCGSVGDYDVVIPEDTPDGEYKIRVGLFGTDELFACSDTFDVEEVGDDDLSFVM